MYKKVADVLHKPDFPVNHFLDPSEQEQLVAGLAYYGLLKLDNTHNLPLKSGGTTDIYINIRDARNNPKAIAFLADLFASAIKRLNVDCFADVPQAVSCLSGSIAERTNLPMLTIREQAKENRATQGLIIGDAKPNKRAAIFDDVITVGTSKVVPFNALVAKGILPYLVVMVDRQQGWQKMFAKHGIHMPVWAGTDLHTVRRHCIDTFGLMQRCDPTMAQYNPFIISLDGKPWEDILPIAEQLRPTGAIFKINDLLHTQNRAHIVRDVGVYGKVMVDLKGHDIPETVYNTCRQYRESNAWAVTVHASGDSEMVQAAKRALEGTPTKVLAVTALTSLDEEACQRIYDRSRDCTVNNLAAVAEKGRGCDGFVCSGNEVASLKKQYPHMTFVVPGTRSPGADTHDQKNVVTHAEALKRGATKLIAGRQFLNAPDPIAELKRVMTEELNIVL